MSSTKKLISEVCEDSPLVMIAEDDDGIRETLSRYLSMNGYRVVQARDGQEAVVCFRADSDAINICLVDLNMPELDGGSCICKIRESSKSVPIFLMTGEDDEADLPEYVTSNIAKRLTKPFDWAMLVDDIGKILHETKSGNS